MRETDREWCGALVRLAFKDEQAIESIGPFLVPTNLYRNTSNFLGNRRAVVNPLQGNGRPLSH